MLAQSKKQGLGMKAVKADKVSVVIAARNEAASITSTITAVFGQEINGAELEFDAAYPRVPSPLPVNAAMIGALSCLLTVR